jgi:hypothetical protein
MHEEMPLRLTVRDEEFPCGYGPRSLRLSLDRNHLFVGCKDGSVTSVDLALACNPETRSRARRLLCGRQDTGVRSLCDLGNGWLLCGQDDGGVATIGWQDPWAERPVRWAELSARCAGGVGYVGRWDDEPAIFVISPRRQEAFHLRLGTGGPQADAPFDLVLAATLPGVEAMSGFMRTAAERCIVCKTGALWLSAPEGLESQDHLWRDWRLERPGFVFDNAVVRATETGPDLGIYLSTDEGVFLLRPWSPPGPEERGTGHARFRIDPVFLPGISRTGLAITHAVQDSRCFLWVSDTDGSVHHYWSELRFWTDWQDRVPLWRRSGLLERRFPVMRAVASWSPGDVHQAVVSQACRDDRIVVSWYSSQEAQDAAATSAAADLLSWGNAERLRRRLHPDDERRGWCVEALVADHIEETANDPEQLRRFLRNPGFDLACSALQEILASGVTDPPASGRSRAERAGQAITLWTHTLIGTVHRRLANATTRDYLGIIRWLRRLGQSPLLQSTRAGDGRLHGAIEDSILYARKWGVFGATYAARQHVFAALAPLAAQQQTPGRSFDRLVYESLIFRRRMDVAEVLPPPPDGQHALPPWELRHFPMPGPAAAEYVAVSWADGCTIYRRSAPEAPWARLTRGGAAPASARTPGRRMLLGACGPGTLARPYILSAPAPPEKGPEKLELHFLDGDEPLERAGQLGVRELLAPRDDSGARESVYSLLDLGAGRVVVGLQGAMGTARFGLLEVQSDGSLEALRPPPEMSFSTVYPESKTLPRNPIWSIASHGASADQAVLFLGCGDGQIWKVRVSIPGPDRFEISKPIVVARLGAPVTALACRTTERKEIPLLRVFAGLADGTLIAFQALGDWPRDEEEYATLWATREETRVRSIHCFCSPLLAPGARENDDARQLVLAITQQGTAILVVDRAAVERLEAGDGDKLKRLRLPGQQLGRLALGFPVFGSALLPMAPQAGDEGAPALAHLIAASASGGPRVISLHHPKFTPDRHDKFARLLADWLQQLRGSGERIRGSQMRRPETTYAAAPALPAVLVRWILPSDPDAEPWVERGRHEGPEDDLGPGRQWLPRHLRHLVDLDTAWKGNAPLDGLLKKALLAARAIEDRALFKEILEATLIRANHQLFQEAMSGGEIRFATAFRELLDDLEEVRGAWEGMTEGLDTRMRITVAKNLLDGDTLWSLSRMRILARAGGGTRAAGPDPLAKAMQGRIDVVHQFLGKGDPLLALETLRAANRALLRLCRRLVRREPEDWIEIGAESHLDWGTISAFFQAVGDFAARIAHSKGTLGVVAAHEVCRAYALGMLACPSEMVRLAIWLAEADLPIDIGRRLEQQLVLLGELLGEARGQLPPKLRIVLRTALHVPQGGDYWKSLFFPRARQERRLGWVLDPQQVGSGNAEMIAARRPFDLIIVWLHDLAGHLANDAGAVELQRHAELYRGITEDVSRNPESAQDQFRHSRRFWKSALGDLAAECGRFPHLFPPGDAVPGRELRPPPVRPELVLFSGALGEWCRRHRDEIQRLRQEHQLFEPMSSLADEALALVERTADHFRLGTAVQKSLVVGVLSHGLLEMLDEHLLEVWEVAQALDPRRAWEQEIAEALGPRRTWEQAEIAGARQRRPPASTAARFADYLLQRAWKAEVVPKNLRSLLGLMGFTTEDNGGKGADSHLTLTNLLREFESDWKWRLPDLPDAMDEKLKRRTYHFLHLTLTELAQNDRVHGQGGPPRVFRILDIGRPEELALGLEFHYPLEDKAFERAQQLAADALQGMIAPRDDPRFPSHGTGLYLANLAAGAVGWRLELDPRERGKLLFKLTRKGGRGR